MDQKAFKAQLEKDGYTEIQIKTMEPGLYIDEHTHPFDVRALVLSGEATLGCHGEKKTYRTGDVLELAANTVHTEQYGDAGYEFLLGRRMV